MKKQAEEKQYNLTPVSGALKQLIDDCTRCKHLEKQTYITEKHGVATQICKYCLNIIAFDKTKMHQANAKKKTK